MLALILSLCLAIYIDDCDFINFIFKLSFYCKNPRINVRYEVIRINKFDLIYLRVLG